jgi:arabinose-5-phosphate isomerase
MKDIAKKVFDIEIESLQKVAGLIDDEFTKAVDAILNKDSSYFIKHRYAKFFPSPR